MERQKAGWTFWCVVALALPLIYLAAAAPVCCIASRVGRPGIVNAAYGPFTNYIGVDNPLARGFMSYCELAADESYWVCTLDDEFEWYQSEPGSWRPNRGAP
jgi:hypothetical protein